MPTARCLRFEQADQHVVHVAIAAGADLVDLVVGGLAQPQNSRGCGTGQLLVQAVCTHEIPVAAPPHLSTSICRIRKSWRVVGNLRILPTSRGLGPKLSGIMGHGRDATGICLPTLPCLLCAAGQAGSRRSLPRLGASAIHAKLTSPMRGIDVAYSCRQSLPEAFMLCGNFADRRRLDGTISQHPSWAARPSRTVSRPSSNTTSGGEWFASHAFFSSIGKRPVAISRSRARCLALQGRPPDVPERWVPDAVDLPASR